MIYKRLVPKIVVYRDIVDESSQFTSILTRNYEPHRNIGLPLEQIKILQSNLVDEITITQVNKFGFDYKFVDLIQNISEIVSTPISVGGFISEWSHASALFQAGADKIILGQSKSNRQLASKISEELITQIETNPRSKYVLKNLFVMLKKLALVKLFSTTSLLMVQEKG
jgi:imidazole glycerol phosphate synthase subunit HisF